MKSIFILLVTMFTIVLAQGNESSITSISPYEKAVEKAIEEKKSLIVFVYTDYCPWCERMKVHTLEDFDVVEIINSKFIFTKLHKSTLPNYLQVKYVPVTFIIDPNSKKIKKTISGYKSPEDLVTLLELFLEE